MRHKKQPDVSCSDISRVNNDAGKSGTKHKKHGKIPQLFSDFQLNNFKIDSITLAMRNRIVSRCRSLFLRPLRLIIPQSIWRLSYVSKAGR